MLLHWFFWDPLRISLKSEHSSAFQVHFLYVWIWHHTFLINPFAGKTGHPLPARYCFSSFSWRLLGKHNFCWLQGIISSGIVIALQTWCIQKGGPVFVSIFQPLQTALVAVMAYIILGDKLHTGGYIIKLDAYMHDPAKLIKQTVNLHLHCWLILLCMQDYWGCSYHGWAILGFMGKNSREENGKVQQWRNIDKKSPGWQQQSERVLRSNWHSIRYQRFNISTITLC